MLMRRTKNNDVNKNGPIVMISLSSICLSRVLMFLPLSRVIMFSFIIKSNNLFRVLRFKVPEREKRAAHPQKKILPAEKQRVRDW